MIAPTALGVDAKWKPYLTYRDSGVEWLGDVPEHWDVKRLKGVLRETLDKVEALPEECHYIGLEHIESGTGVAKPVDPGDAQAVGAVTRYSPCHVLFGKLRPYLAKVVRPTSSGCASTEMIVYEPSPGTDRNFAFYCLLSKGFVDLVNAQTYGTKMPRANPEQLGIIGLPVPPEREQRAIAAFLDRETDKIDALVEKKRRLIELLKEKRAAMISHAVTKGLDPTAPMKDSGIPWLGQIPAHWTLTPNKAFLAHVQRPVGDAWAETQLLSLTLKGVIERDIESGFGKYPSDFSLYQTVLPDELVFCLFDMDETPRTVGLVEAPGMLTSAYDVFRVRPNADAQFLAFLYENIDSFKGLRPYYTGLRKVVRTPTFMSIQVALPPLAEQTRIAEFIRTSNAKLDGLARRLESQVNVLQEFRSALISAAVTGKIDVREAHE